MTLTGCERELLRRLASMPFLDRLDLVAISGWSRGAVYEGVGKLEDTGLAASVPHATDLIPPTRRFHLTAAGIRTLVQEEGVSLSELLRARPLSVQWLRILAERIDALAVIYRLASTISNIAYPIRLRLYRAMPMDAAIALPGGRTVAVVRQGLTSDRTGFAKRIWRLRDGPLPGAVLLLLPDEVRLRHARRLLTSTSLPAFLALESDAALAGGDDPIWRPPSVNAALDLRYVLARMRPGGAPPAERRPSRASLTAYGAGRDIPGYLLPAPLKPAEKRVLDLLYDWPWISPNDLASLLAVSEPRASQLVTPLEAFGLVTRLSADNLSTRQVEPGVPAASRLSERQAGRLALTDQGLALLARRDRTSVGVARKRWSVAPLDPEGPASWRNVSGARSRQLVRNAEHTGAVHAFIAALARQCRALRWEMAQLDPSRRASRYFRHGEKLRSIHPDAFGVLRRGPVTWPFFLEWERRAVRPVTMAARLAPYLRYYSSHRPTDDHGAQPAVLVVFDDDLAATWRRPTSCGWPGRRWTGPGSECPCGSLTGPPSMPWVPWDGPGAPPATGSPPICWAPNIRHGTGVEQRLSPRPERRSQKHEFGPHRRIGRPPEASETHRRPAQHSGALGAAGAAGPLPELAGGEGRDQPRLPVHAGQRRARAFGSHPPSDAGGPRRRGLPSALHIGGRQ